MWRRKDITPTTTRKARDGWLIDGIPLSFSSLRSWELRSISSVFTQDWIEWFLGWRQSTDASRSRVHWVWEFKKWCFFDLLVFWVCFQHFCSLETTSFFLLMVCFIGGHGLRGVWLASVACIASNVNVNFLQENFSFKVSAPIYDLSLSRAQ